MDKSDLSVDIVMPNRLATKGALRVSLLNAGAHLMVRDAITQPIRIVCLPKLKQFIDRSAKVNGKRKRNTDRWR